MTKPRPASLDALPLYPAESDLARVVVGAERAGQWDAIAQMLEREGLPVIDTLMGGRFLPAVEAFFRVRHGLDRAASPESTLPAKGRVKVVPFRPDGDEHPNAQTQKAFHRRGSALPARRARP